jgi:hypothetical protein
MDDRTYFPNDFSAGYPAGELIYYECTVCGISVPSMPRNAAACKCRNIIIDADAGRVAVKDVSRMRAYQVTFSSEGARRDSDA